MTVTLLDITRAAAGRGAVVTADMAGYLVLGLLDRLVLAPSEPAAGGVCLLEDGSVHIADSRPADPIVAEGAARVVLGNLLAVASGGTSVLSRVADGKGNGALGGEVEAALIPLNRAAGRRALARLHREVARAKDRGLMAAPPVSLAVPPRPPAAESVDDVDSAAPDADIPIELDIGAPVELDVPVDVAPIEPRIPARDPEALSAKAAAWSIGSRVWSVDTTQRVPDVAPVVADAVDIEPPIAPAEPESRCWEGVEPERTPLLGTVAGHLQLTLRSTAPTPDEEPFRSPQHTPPLPPPKLDAPVVRHPVPPPVRVFALNEREHTPPLPEPELYQRPDFSSDVPAEQSDAPEALLAHLLEQSEAPAEVVPVQSEAPEALEQSEAPEVLEQSEVPAHVVSELLEQSAEPAEALPVRGEAPEALFEQSAAPAEVALVQSEALKALLEQSKAPAEVVPAQSEVPEALFEQSEVPAEVVPVQSHASPEAAPEPVESNAEEPPLATPPAPEPRYTPRRSDIRELLAAFTVADTRPDQDISRELKTMAGIDLTPPPVAVSDEADDEVAPATRPVAKGRPWRFGIVGCGILALGALLRSSTDTSGFAATGDPVCEATLVLKGTTPGSEVRVRALGIDEPWLSRVADAPIVELGGLRCNRPHEIVVRGAEDWHRFEVRADEVAPEPGQQRVRHEIAFR